MPLSPKAKEHRLLCTSVCASKTGDFEHKAKKFSTTCYIYLSKIGMTFSLLFYNNAEQRAKQAKKQNIYRIVRKDNITHSNQLTGHQLPFNQHSLCSLCHVWLIFISLRLRVFQVAFFLMLFIPVFSWSGRDSKMLFMTKSSSKPNLAVLTIALFEVIPKDKNHSLVTSLIVA